MNQLLNPDEPAPKDLANEAPKAELAAARALIDKVSAPEIFKALELVHTQYAPDVYVAACELVSEKLKALAKPHNPEASPLLEENDGRELDGTLTSPPKQIAPDL